MCVGQADLEFGVDRAGRAVSAVPVHARCTDLCGDGGDNLAGGAAPQNECSAQSGDVPLQSSKRVVKPPARGGTEGSDLGGFVVENVQNRGVVARGECCGERRVVGETKVVAQPDE